ncbi:hypothetical protein LTR62_006806 [Meristemomyces frigidus]|uniref:Uncharacterized protein n=1 Tax=Meristemomyces frigidus TaxID=1508187 RepID=A0AAN7TD78_9PEZI|nr:hypothetical protein LTR62_006806 [Meristemomyces frigidus]
MRLLALTVAAATLAIAYDIAADQATCAGKKHGHNAVAAIQQFCAKTDMVVPSDYASTGATHGGARAFITSKCNPPQWVPAYWCEAQFYNLCATSELGIAGTLRFGTDGCQYFSIAQ